jgi:endonuclease G
MINTSGDPGPDDIVRDARPHRSSTEALAIDPDYSTRDGYREDFLGLPVPLPGHQAWAEVASAELTYHHFSIVMHRRRRLALYTAVNIDGRTATRPSRDSDRWIIDPRLPRDEQTNDELYRDNSLDRGHLVRRLDPAWGPVAEAATDDTFHFTNATPQHHDFNAGQSLWAGLEDYILHNTDNRDLTVSVVTGPVLHDDDPAYRGVALPRQFYKLVAMVTTTGRLSVTAYLLSQEALLEDFAVAPEEFSFGAYRTFQVPVRRIADLTGLDLTPHIGADPLDRLKATVLPREILRPEDILLTS